MWTMLVALQAATTPVPAAIEADLTCLAVIAMSVERATPEQRSGLIGGLMYFMGRIDQVRPGFDYAGQLTRLMNASDATDKLRAAQPRCSTILRERGESMQRWGQALQNSGKR